MALARHGDDARTGSKRQLHREHADAAAGPRDHDCLPGGRRHRAHGGEPRRTCDEQ